MEWVSGFRFSGFGLEGFGLRVQGFRVPVGIPDFFREPYSVFYKCSLTSQGSLNAIFKGPSRGEGFRKRGWQECRS